MRKILSLIISVVIILSFTSCIGDLDSGDKSGKLKVKTTIYPIHYFASIIGGDKAEVESLLKVGEDAHSFELSLSNRLSLEKADVFIYSGAGMEDWADSVISSIENKKLTILEAASVVKLLESDHDDHEENDEHDHEHGVYDPHIWLSPVNAKLIIEKIKTVFSQKDPENAAYYQSNYNTYAAKLDELDAQYKSELSEAKNRTIVVAHQAYGYLCNEYNLTQVYLQGLFNEDEISPNKLEEVINFVKQNKIKVLFWEEIGGDASNVNIVKEAVLPHQVTLMVLSAIEFLTQTQIDSGENYFTVMQANLEALKTALLSNSIFYNKITH